MPWLAVCFVGTHMPVRCKGRHYRQLTGSCDWFTCTCSPPCVPTQFPDVPVPCHCNSICMNVEQGESGDCQLQSLTAPPAFPLCLLAPANSTMSDTTPPRLPLVTPKETAACRCRSRIQVSHNKSRLFSDTLPNPAPASDSLLSASTHHSI